MENSEIDITTLGIMSTGDVANYLGIGITTVYRLVSSYQIPHVDTAASKIFLKRDIDAFQRMRMEKLKRYGKSVKNKL